MKSYLKNSIKGRRRKSHWKEGVARAHHDATVREDGETPAMITPLAMERALPRGIALKESKFLTLPQITTSHDVFIQGKLDRILDLKRNGQVLTPFTNKIHSIKLPIGFVKHGL